MTVNLRRPWTVSLFLWLPIAVPYLCHWLFPPLPGSLPTGLIQYDMPYYMINARKHFDEGFTLTYGLPFSPFADTPRLYFQPQTFLLGVVWKITGLDPAALYLLFGFFSGWFCVRLAVAVFVKLFGAAPANRLALILWVWGGGLAVFAGLGKFASTRQLDDLFWLDPNGGMWLLNFGRNLLYPMEAYLHAVFLGMIYFLLDGRHGLVLALLALLSMSHPFTGLEAILIVLAWYLLEGLVVRNRIVPWIWPGLLILLLWLHVGYYLGLLNTSVEHRSLQEQWLGQWIYQAKEWLPAYALVGSLASWPMRTPARALAYLAAPSTRFFLTWFLVAFALSKNELVFDPPYQPLHFTRGYVWMPLFLLGAPTLIDLLTWLYARPVLQKQCGTLAIMAIFLADNALFLTTFHWRNRVARDEVRIHRHLQELAGFLGTLDNRGELLIGPEPAGNYVLMLYCPFRTWASHSANTPFFNQRKQELADFYQAGKVPEEWRSRSLLIVYDADQAPPHGFPLAHHQDKRIYEAKRYQVYRFGPGELAD